MRARSAVLLFLLCLLPAAPAPAPVIVTGDGSGNVTAPPDDPGWANVGASPNTLSGVYLGKGWVLTAAHVGDVTDFTFEGVVYDTVPGSRQLIWKDGSQADLAMIRLYRPWPPLPDVVLASAPIAEDDVLTLVGHGWNRASTSTCWDMTWSELPCPAGVYAGYERSGPRTKRWGVNRVTTVGSTLPGSGRSTEVFEMVFDEVGEAHEAQVVSGDSGGAAFLEREGQWELVGIHAAIAVFMNQPSDTAVFGNLGLSADVHHYRSEIEAILNPPVQVPALPWPTWWAAAAGVLLAARSQLSRTRLSRSR